MEITQLKKQLMDDEKVGNPKIKTKRLIKQKKTIEREAELENYILRKKELNEFIQNDNKMHQNLVKKSANTNNIFEKIKFEKFNKERQAQDGIKKFVHKAVKTLKLTKIGRFRSLVYICMSIRKFKHLLRESQMVVKITSLNSFLKTKDSMDNLITNLVFGSIKNVYQDILSNSNLQLDLSDTEGGFHKKQQNEEKYIKLEVTLF
jgi:hypothetical protein